MDLGLDLQLVNVEVIQNILICPIDPGKFIIWHRFPHRSTQTQVLKVTVLP
jgi:hypothetical protein